MLEIGWYVSTLFCKKLKDIDFVSDGPGEIALNFEFSIVPIMLTYGDIISFPNKLKFNHINIFRNYSILKKKIINTCPSYALISLKS